MIKILIATGNQGKYREILEVLGDLEGIEFVSLKDIGLQNDVEENGITYEENSLLKAKYFFEKTGMITMSEDSGIEVEALKDELGVKTRRWGAGEHASDEEWLEYFLEKMQQEENKRAKFVCVPTIMWPEASQKSKVCKVESEQGNYELRITNDQESEENEEFPVRQAQGRRMTNDTKKIQNSKFKTQNFNIKQFRSETWGNLLDEPQCPVPHGVPISAVFVADGSDKVYAALSTHEKNAISHRGKAMHKTKEFLQAQFC